MSSLAVYPYPKNESNLVLDHEADLARRAIRGAGVSGVGAAAAGGTIQGSGAGQPGDADLLDALIEITAAGDHAAIQGFGSFKIVIYELGLYNLDDGTVELWDGATRKLHGAFTDWPAGSSFGLDNTGRRHWKLSAGNSFIVKTAGRLSGFARYYLEQ